MCIASMVYCTLSTGKHATTPYTLVCDGCQCDEVANRVSKPCVHVKLFFCTKAAATLVNATHVGLEQLPLLTQLIRWWRSNTWWRNSLAQIVCSYASSIKPSELLGMLVRGEHSKELALHVINKSIHVVRDCCKGLHVCQPSPCPWVCSWLKFAILFDRRLRLALHLPKHCSKCLCMCLWLTSPRLVEFDPTAQQLDTHWGHFPIHKDFTVRFAVPLLHICQASLSCHGTKGSQKNSIKLVLFGSCGQLHLHAR